MTPWIAFAGGVIAAALSAFITLRQVRLKSELDLNAQRAQTLATYREPLAAAAFDLQSRLYNILRLDFFDRWEERADDAERTTLFRIAQYLRLDGDPAPGHSVPCVSRGRRDAQRRRDPVPDRGMLPDPRAGHGDDDLE